MRRHRSLGKRFAGFLGLLGGAVALVGPASAAEKETDVNNFGDWSVVCIEEKGRVESDLPPCEIVQTVRARGDKQTTLRLAFAHSGTREAYGMHLSLPGDIRASGGVVIRLDGAVDLEYPVMACKDAQCISEKLLPPDDIALLQKAEKGFVAMVDKNAQLKRIPLSFDGFNGALSEMVRRNKAWADE